MNNGPLRKFNLICKFVVILVLPIFILAGCNKFLSSDSGRAQELIETLISEPDNLAKLNQITLNKAWSDENIKPFIHGKNTLLYLGARIKQDQMLEYKLSRKTNLSNKQSYVEVAVSEKGSGVLRSKKFSYVFRVFFKENESGENIIIRSESLN